jgi:hypothetical protein
LLPDLAIWKAQELCLDVKLNENPIQQPVKGGLQLKQPRANPFHCSPELTPDLAAIC